MVADSDRDPGLPFFEIPNWAVRLVVLTIVVGFPVALVIACDSSSPEGLERTEDVDLAARPRTKSHAWIYLIMGIRSHLYKVAVEATGVAS